MPHNVRQTDKSVAIEVSKPQLCGREKHNVKLLFLELIDIVLSICCSVRANKSNVGIAMDTKCWSWFGSGSGSGSGNGSWSRVVFRIDTGWVYKSIDSQF